MRDPQAAALIKAAVVVGNVLQQKANLHLMQHQESKRW